MPNKTKTTKAAAMVGKTFTLCAPRQLRVTCQGIIINISFRNSHIRIIMPHECMNMRTPKFAPLNHRISEYLHRLHDTLGDISNGNGRTLVVLFQLAEFSRRGSLDLPISASGLNQSVKRPLPSAQRRHQQMWGGEDISSTCTY